MEGRRCRDIIWGRKVPQVLQKRGSVILKRGEKERAAHRVLQKENTSVKPLTRKTRGDDYHEFLQPVEDKHWSFRGLQHGQYGA